MESRSLLVREFYNLCMLVLSYKMACLDEANDKWRFGGARIGLVKEVNLDGSTFLSKLES